MKKITLLLACALVASAPAFAQKACTKAESDAANKSMDRIAGWPALHKAYADYKHCDTGPLEDAFTDVILRLMIDWKNVEALANDVKKDGDYMAWLAKHLQSPAAKDDRQDVYSRAKKDCPSKLDAFCADLAEVVKKGAGEARKASPENAPLDFTPMKPLTPTK